VKPAAQQDTMQQLTILFIDRTVEAENNNQTMVAFFER
jgi:hypothetical protein